MTIKFVILISTIYFFVSAASAGWCYYGGCNASNGIFACPSMANSVGWGNMRVLFNTRCDKWHERLWGRKHFCCTKDCQYQKCGKSCTRLGMKAVEENDHTRPKACTAKGFDGDEFDTTMNFCCP
ncbi:hypothetical protein HA402_008972 [Bradysia odoriphaga]|nr:hypothetical protein HA402_008968 [Bradysia odoriphaga]KAG4071237.1 hypothetical protein HA402_008972 [Bradysia odoriphaga]